MENKQYHLNTNDETEGTHLNNVLVLLNTSRWLLGSPPLVSRLKLPPR